MRRNLPVRNIRQLRHLANNRLAPDTNDRHVIAPVNSSVQNCAAALVVVTTVKRARWHGSAWRRWSCAENKRRG